MTEIREIKEKRIIKLCDDTVIVITVICFGIDDTKLQQTVEIV